MRANGESAAPPQSGPMAESLIENPDVSLIQAAQQGDHAAFERLIERHGGKVASVVGQLLDNPNDAEDALQETFVRAFENLGSFRAEASLRTWLIRIAVNVSKNKRGGFWRRRVRLGEWLSLRSMAAPRPDALAETALIQKERQRALRAALRQLPDKYRLPILLHFFEDLTGAEIAEILGWNESTVWSRIYAGCRALRKHLAAYAGP